jgi:hypothetical protein
LPDHGGKTAIALENAFLDEIHDLEGSTKMRYISSAERIGGVPGKNQ